MKTKKTLYIGGKIVLLCVLLSTTVFGATLVATSDDGRIQFQSGKTEYVNIGENSSIIGNELRGFYFDEFFGLYEFQNLRFADSTTRCSVGYGYQLSGNAVSEFAGSIDLSDLYYCVDTQSLHGDAFRSISGTQAFEWIIFILDSGVTTGVDVGNSIFVNDTTDINDIRKELEKNFDSSKGSQFYIIK